MDEEPELEPKEIVKLDASQASKIYLLPNLFTAGNLFFGFLAIKNCIQARYGMMVGDETTDPNALFREAVLFILGGMLCDTLDGRVARLGGRESLFGKEFDSIADIVTFGMAPALMVLFLILNPGQNEEFITKAGFFLAFIYLLCAAVRLSRFNVITHPAVRSRKLEEADGDFLGLPVPAAAGMIATIVLVMTKHDALRIYALGLPVLMLLISVLMISNVRYPSFKKIDWNTQIKFTSFVGVLVIGGLVYFSREYALALIFFSYLFFGLGRHLLRLKRIADRKSKVAKQV